MKLWQRRLLGLLAIGGGVLGVTVAIPLVAQATRVIEWVIFILFVGVYAWGVWGGLILIEGRPRAERINRWFWLIQIPAFTTPAIGYSLSCGFHFVVSLTFSPFKLGVSSYLGSSYNFQLLQDDQPFSIGVNLFALVVFLWLGGLTRSQRTAELSSAA